MSIKNFKTVSLLISGVVLLSGCDNPKDPTKENFGAAISQYLAKTGDLCIDTGTLPFDVVQAAQPFPDHRVKKFDALVAVGLASKKEVDIQGQGFNSKKTYKGFRYELTEAAAPYIPADVDDTKTARPFGLWGKPENQLCWGKKALAEIIKWDGPVKFGDYQEAGITYTYKLVDLTEWAKDPAVQDAFPQVKTTIADASKRELKRAVKLTNLGWETK